MKDVAGALDSKSCVAQIATTHFCIANCGTPFCGLVTILMGVRSELVGMEYVPFVVPCVGLVEFAEVVLVDHLCSADQQVPNQFVVEVPIVE